MKTYWINATGRLIVCTTDPNALVPGAVTSTTVQPDSAKYQSWNGSVWVDDADRTTREQRRTDLQALHEAGRDISLVLTELVDWQLANTAMSATDFSANVKQAYLGLKTIADRVKV